MSEIRCINIISCKDCPFSGSVIDSMKEYNTYFCSYVPNMMIDQLPAERVNDEIYPITSISRYNVNEIPYWCKLPKSIEKS